MQGHQDDGGVVFLDVVGVGHQAHLFQELLDGLELTGHADQLLEVLDAALGLDRTLVFELGDVAGVSQDGLEGRGRTLVELEDEALMELEERRDPPDRRAGHASVVGSLERLEERVAVQLGEGIDLGHRGVADPALRGVQNALEGDLVAGVGDALEVRDRVLDFLAVIEPSAADDLVGNADAHEVLLEHAALRVGAVEHRHLAPPVVAPIVKS